MKILIVSGSMPPMNCGVGDYTFLLAKNLANLEGNQISVITKSLAKEVNDHNFNVFPLIEKWNIRTLLLVRRHIKEWNPDIIHIQYPTSGYGRSMLPSFLPYILKSIAPVVQTWHEYLSRKGYIRYLPNLLAGDLFIVVRDNYLSSLPKFYRKVLGSKIDKISVASAIPKYNPSISERVQIREKYIDSDSSILVTFFGFISEHKCIDKIIDLVDKENQTLVLIGSISEEKPFHRKILDKINKLKFKNSVQVTGYLESLEVAKILSVSDVSIFPFCDGVDECNTSFLAAKIQGGLVIATHKSKIGFHKSENVWYVKPGDYREIENILMNLPTFKKVENNKYSWEEIAKKHQSSYTNLLSHYGRIHTKNS